MHNSMRLYTYENNVSMRMNKARIRVKVKGESEGEGCDVVCMGLQNLKFKKRKKHSGVMDNQQRHK